MGKNGITINDVALRTGVSKVTVSNVLNKRETGIRISEATRNRVLQAAREMGYHPNALARNLARRRSDTITLVFQFPRVFSGWSGFTNELMRGTVDRVNDLGFDLMLHTKAMPDLERDVLSLTDGRADGALVLRDTDDPLMARLAQRGFPFIQVFSRSAAPGAWFVDCDNVAGGRLATEYLLDLGHTRIGHVGGSARSSSSADRREGYEQALTARGITPNPDWIARIGYAGGDFGPLLAMMDREDAPTALFVWSDDVAVRAMRVLKEELGKRVPEDVSIIGFDGLEIGEHTVPRLTSVRQPVYDMAARGVELLVARIKKESVEETQVFFAPTLVRRDSCAPPAVGTPS